MSEGEAHKAIHAVWRIESARLIARLARITKDVGMAEELAQEALLAALQAWPRTGVPEKPAAWLMATAKRRAVDAFRHREMAQRKAGQIAHDIETDQMPDLDAALDDDIGDDLLRLIFTACHPALSPEAQAALTLRMVGGLTTEEIARAFLVPEATLAQRIVRAKRTLADARVPYEVPRGDDRAERLEAVLGVIYLIFNEGYSATAGGDWMRPQLMQEALRLGRILAGLMPAEPEVHGLGALMELQASRAGARVGPDGEPILLLDQNRARWDPMLIRRGLIALGRAEKLGPRGPYTLQAAIAACHASARIADQTDWPRIAALYAALAQIAPSPIVELNRAVALSMAFGPQAGLDLVDQLVDEPSLKTYHLLPAVRGDLLAKLGRHEEARAEFTRAAALTRNDREKTMLLERARS